MKDLIDEMDAVRRRVGAGSLPAGDAHVVSLSRDYPAEIDDVWDAVTTPERIARWFMPVSGELRLGGTYQLEGNAGGEIRVCEPPTLLRVTWVLGDTPDLDDSTVEVRLESLPGGTRLTLEHTAVPPEEFWGTYGPGAVGVGWDLSLIGLGAHLAGVELGSPEQMDADPRIRECMLDSARRWGAAHEASGVAPEIAADAASATAAFYVPPPE